MLGLSMEARMARIESMMESLMLERGMTVSPRLSMERDAAASERLHADFLMQIAGEASLSFPPITQGDFGNDNPGRIRHSVSAVSPMGGGDPSSTLHVGAKTCLFPNPTEYQRLLDVFFDDIAPYYPCVNELEFRMGSDKLLSASSIRANDITLLALNYIIFACCEMTVTPGWSFPSTSNADRVEH